jgi:hypothetical protein
MLPCRIKASVCMGSLSHYCVACATIEQYCKQWEKWAQADMVMQFYFLFS